MGGDPGVACRSTMEARQPLKLTIGPSWSSNAMSSCKRPTASLHQQVARVVLVPVPGAQCQGRLGAALVSRDAPSPVAFERGAQRVSDRFDSPSTCSSPPMGRFVTGSKAPCSPSRTFVLGGCLRPRGGARHLRGADWLENPTYEGYHRACVVQGSCAVTQTPRTASGDAHSPR